MSTTVTPDARPLLDALLADALLRRASDVHIEPTPAGYDVRLRVDGLLLTCASYPQEIGRALVARLMVLAQLLTYRLDIPQEGRIELPAVADSPTALALRLSIMPTAHGLRAALRLPADFLQPQSLHELHLPAPVLSVLQQFAVADSGLLLLTGPAGSGKTTTIYALLQHILQVSNSTLSVITLEDPVERALPGVTQIQVTPHGELTYERALRSILRQDPQVLMLGEIRDPATASLAVQAALSGHRLISTLHASSPAAALSRLLEMGLEPYQLTSSLFGVVSQRLLRKLAPPNSPTPYVGRLPVAEIITLDAALRAAVLQHADAATMQQLFPAQPTYVSMHKVAADLIRLQLTDAPEVARVLGTP